MLATPELIAESVPFLMAYLVQSLQSGMRRLAENTLRSMLPDDCVMDGYPREIAVDLSVQFYRQFSFIVAVLLSCVSSIVLTVTSVRPLASEVHKKSF